MTKINKVSSYEIKEELIIQANDGEKLFKLIEHLQEKMLTKEAIVQLFNFDIRQASYYAEALIAMHLTEYYKIYNQTFLGLNLVAKKIHTKKNLCLHLKNIDFIFKQNQKLSLSNFSFKTKKRRQQSIDAIKKWINQH